MSISGIGSPVPPPPANTGDSGNGGNGAERENTALGALDYNAFLQLLVAQLKYQDPTKPMDSTEYLGQLASYANVEQNIRTNTRLDEVMSAVRADHASNLLGRTVRSADGAISGTVEAYEMKDTQVVLLLDNGARLPMDADVQVLA